MTELRISMRRKYEDAKHPSTFYIAWKSDNRSFIDIDLIAVINRISE